MFGYSTASPARLVNLRAVHRAYTADARNDDSAALSSDNGTHTSVMHFDDAQNSIDVPVINRLSLKPGQTFTGPAVVEQADTTTVVRPGWQATLHDSSHLVLTQ